MKKIFILFGLFLSVNSFSQLTLNNYTFGGSNNEYAYENCFDADGNFIVVGVVIGSDMYFTDTIGNIDNSNKNIFIRKYSNDLTTLLASTIICGSGNDYCKSVDTDSQGNVFIGGFTVSSDMPVSATAYQQNNNSIGNYDGYIIKLNSDLNTLLAATYFGGEDKDKIYKLRIDQNDNVIVVGSTHSTGNIALAGGFDTSYNGTTGSIYDFGDGYLAVFDNNLENKIAGTYLGDAGDEACFSLTTNNDNNIVICGTTNSDNYPVSSDAFMTEANGGMEMIVTELSADLSQIIKSTYISGYGNDIAWDIAYNETENSYVIGAQTSSGFNISGDVADNTYNGGYGDGFIVILNGNMQNIHSATFVGGDSPDLITSIKCKDNNTIIYGGITESSDLPTSNDAYYPDFLEENDWADGFFGSIDYDLSEFSYLSYFGGNNDDQIWSVSSFENNIYISGVTYSSNIESDSTLQGNSDAIISFLENNDPNINVENNITKPNFIVYPNPAKNILHIKTNKETINKQIKIINVSGQIVKTGKLEGTHSVINVSDLPKGLYFIKTDKETYKFTVE